MFTLLDFYVEYFSTEEFQRGTTRLNENKAKKNHYIMSDSQYFILNMLIKYLYCFPKGFILLSVPDFLFRMIQQ